jgi:hypothetical protein
VSATLYLAVQDLALDFNDVPAATILKSTGHGKTWAWDKKKPMCSDHVFTTICTAPGLDTWIQPDGFIVS